MHHSARSSAGGRAHAGPKESHDHRSHNPTVAYRLCGTVADLDGDAGTFLLEVTGGHGHRVGRFRGHTISVDARHAKWLVPDGDDAKPLAGLVAGDQVCVKTRLPRHLDELPETLVASHVEELEGARSRSWKEWRPMGHRKAKRHMAAAW